MKNDRKKDKDWDGYEPMTGTPMTGNMDSSYNYSTNGTTNMTKKYDIDYAPDDMRADADKRKEGYDIETDVKQGFTNDPLLKNNIATQEFDYTKEEVLRD